MNHEWPQPESQVVITFRKTHASKSTHYNPLSWKLLRSHPSPFKTNNHHHPKSSVTTFWPPSNLDIRMREAKAVNKILGWPEKNTTQPPRVGEAQPSEAVAMGEMVSWIGLKTTKGWFWLMISWTQVLHRKMLVQVNSLPVLGPGWKQCWKHPKIRCISKAIMKIYHWIPCCSSKIASMLQTQNSTCTVQPNSTWLYTSTLPPIMVQ